VVVAVEFNAVVVELEEADDVALDEECVGVVAVDDVGCLGVNAEELENALVAARVSWISYSSMSIN